MTGATTTKTVDLDTTGKSALRLVITNGGDNMDYDHGDWAGPAADVRQSFAADEPLSERSQLDVDDERLGAGRA